MTHKEQFAVDAKDGGYPIRFILSTQESDLVADEKLLFCPQAWKAVGKMRGWDSECIMLSGEPNPAFEDNASCIRCKWHSFIEQIADGKTIEEALAVIAN